MSPSLWTLPALVFALGLAAPASAQALELGAKAPALSGVHWIKGKPFAALEPGKVYVVELWATWCGPCKASIPHLTELARKFSGKVDFIGISVQEKKAGPGDTAYLKAVEAFVQNQGGKMVYNVGADGPEGAIAKDWLKASGAPGIPTAFIVNAQGLVSWMGHPMALESALQATLAGTYDLARAARADKAGKDQRAAEMEAAGPFFDAMKRADYAAAEKAGAKLFPAFPTMEANFGYVYYIALGHTNQPRAEAYARTLAGGPYKGKSSSLAMLVQAMAANKDQDPKATLEIAQEALALGVKQNAPMLLDLAGQVCAATGDFKAALAWEEKALAAAAAIGETAMPNAGKIQANLDTYQARLREHPPRP